MSRVDRLRKHLGNPHCPIFYIVKEFRKGQISEINKGRRNYGEYHHLFQILKGYPQKFKMYTRMKVETFEYLLDLVKDGLKKDWCNLHTQPIFPEEALVVTLRFLVTGASYRDLAFAFRMGISTVHGIVKRTLILLCKKLYPVHMPVPKTEDLLDIADGFYSRWGFPNCLGAIDVRHIRIKKPAHSGSRYFNYKKFFSIALQAVVDPDNKFICIDVGGYGGQHDSTTFYASQFYDAVEQGIIKLPADDVLPNSTVALPFFFIGDGAYPLKENLMKPYAGKQLPKDKERFNKRLSRARMVVECAFGRLCQRFQIFYKLLQCTPEMAEWITEAACCLHNLIIDVERKDKVCKRGKTSRQKRMRKSKVGFATMRASQVREKLNKFIQKNPLRK